MRDYIDDAGQWIDQAEQMLNNKLPDYFSPAETLERRLADAKEARMPLRRAAQLLGRVRGDINAARRDQINSVMRPPLAAEKFGSEVRSALRGMAKTERKAVLDTALVDADLVVIHAVLSAPAFLSGLDAERQDTLRQRLTALASQADQPGANATALLDEISTLQQRLNALVQHAEKIIQTAPEKLISMGTAA